MQHFVFLTGHMACKNLEAQLQQMEPDQFSWEVINVGVKVAALMSESLLEKRLPKLLTQQKDIDKIVIPGLFGGDPQTLTDTFGITFERGPRDLRDLPEFFGAKAKAIDLSPYSSRIFAEIVDAPNLTPEQTLQRAAYYAGCGADVIDIGCLPGRKFPHLSQTIKLLKSEGFTVSIDSANTDELLAGTAAGADYFLSVTESTQWIMDETDATPIVIPENSDMDSLYRVMENFNKRSIDYYADPILDPVLMGFTGSVVRYHEVRNRYPECKLFMGIGNVSELIDADTAGVNALLMGVVEELNIQGILTTEVSDHASRTVLEVDLARRIMHAANEDNTIPKHYHKGLLSLHERKPFPYLTEEIKTAASEIREKNYRIQVNDEGIHLYNKNGHHTATDPFELMKVLEPGEDWTHAFYLGVELARAQTAWQLGKRYLQDNELEWGVAHRQAVSQWTDAQPAADQQQEKPDNAQAGINSND